MRRAASDKSENHVAQHRSAVRSENRIVPLERCGWKECRLIRCMGGRPRVVYMVRIGFRAYLYSRARDGRMFLIETERGNGARRNYTHYSGHLVERRYGGEG